MPPPVSARRRPADSRADQRTVRHANLGVVLRHVAQKGPCSRARIAADTGLTRSTVSSLVADLIELDLLHEMGDPDLPRGVGRPAVPLQLGSVVVGVGLEVNVDYLAVVVEGLAGDVQVERRVYGDNRGSRPEEVLDRLAGEAREALHTVEERGLRVAGVCVAVPGLVERDSGSVVVAPNLGWSAVPVAAELRERLGLPVHAENESNLAALAEHWSGAARGFDDFICIFGEIGVGGGIVLDGRLHCGAHGFGGEFGHVVVDLDGSPCACGGRGCVETLVGQEAIARAAGVSTGAGRTSSLTEEIVGRAELGDPRALGALRDAGRWIGTALASAFNLFDLQAVVLGGCFGPMSPWLAGEVAETLRSRSIAARSSSFDVVAAAFGEGAAVRGAAALPLRRVLDAPWTVPSGPVVAEVAV